MKVAAAVGGAAVLTALAACGGAGEQASGETDAPAEPETVEISVSHNQAATHPQHLVLEQVAERVSENTDGTVQLSIFPSSQLGTIPDLIDQFQAGADVITVHNMAQAGDAGGVPNLGAVSAMYAFVGPDGSTGPEAVWPVIQTFLGSDLMQGWTEELMQNNFVMLSANWYLGERNIITDDPEGHPTPADLEGITLRIPDGSTWQTYFNATPANTVTLDGSEVYTSMQQGALNGAEGPYGQMLGWSLQELGKSITLTGHGNDSQGFSTGTATWEKLTPEQQDALKEAFEWGGNEFSRMTVENTEQDRQVIEEAGLTFVQADIDAYRAIAEEAYAGVPGWDPDVMEQIREASGQ